MMNLLQSIHQLPLLAASEGPNYGISWGLILLTVTLGLMVTLKSSGRTSEIKRPGEH